MALAVQTMGAVFKKSTGPGVPIVNLTDVSRSGTSGGVMDTTNLSTTNGIKTYLTSGVYEQGDITIAFNYDPSDGSHTALVTDWQAGTLSDYTMTFGDGVDFFKADMIPVSFDWTNTQAEDGKLEATATLKLSGTTIVDPT